ncbi:threonine-phosphate decarboxylase CobD [Effusibacillus consociatus]|uniref:threonine-phosphate decarboxylase n=1 Tax=Effusibacillus consociatus TaxID=1117041 RepID=A0ABV9PZW2_9BACL
MVMQHGGNITRYQTEWGWSRDKMADFSANLNPLGPPDSVLRAIQEALPRIIDYPDPLGEDVLDALAKKWSLPASRFLLGNGAAELIFLAMRLIQPKKIATVTPAFREYEQAAKVEGAEILRVPLSAQTGFRVESEPLFQVLPKVDLLVLANPNNPTGRCIDRGILDEILHTARDLDKWLLIDEAFLDFLPDEEARTLIRYVTDFEKLIVIRSMTKFYAIAGIRVGYLAAEGHLVDRMREMQVPWSVNTLAQMAAIAGLEDEEFRQRTLDWLQTERKFLSEQLREKGYRVVPSDANFLLVQREDVRIEQLWPKLAEKGIFVRDCRSFAGLDETYFRIAVRAREENRRLLELL